MSHGSCAVLCADRAKHRQNAVVKWQGSESCGSAHGKSAGDRGIAIMRTRSHLQMTYTSHRHQDQVGERTQIVGVEDPLHPPLSGGLRDVSVLPLASCYLLTHASDMEGAFCMSSTKHMRSRFPETEVICNDREPRDRIL